MRWFYTGSAARASAEANAAPLPPPVDGMPYGRWVRGGLLTPDVPVRPPMETTARAAAVAKEEPQEMEEQQEEGEGEEPVDAEEPMEEDEPDAPLFFEDRRGTRGPAVETVQPDPPALSAIPVLPATPVLPAIPVMAAIPALLPAAPTASGSARPESDSDSDSDSDDEEDEDDTDEVNTDDEEAAQDDYVQVRACQDAMDPICWAKLSLLGGAPACKKEPVGPRVRF